MLFDLVGMYNDIIKQAVLRLCTGDNILPNSQINLLIASIISGGKSVKYDEICSET